MDNGHERRNQPKDVQKEIENFSRKCALIFSWVYGKNNA